MSVLGPNKHVVAVVGRPNVGKSTLFNRLTEQRDAITEAKPGVTRDRHYGQSVWNGRTFTVIDTGGYWKDEKSEVFQKAIQKQILCSLEEASLVLFLVDCQAGLTPWDKDFAELLRRLSKPLMVLANKSDNTDLFWQAPVFESLGLGKVHPIAAIDGSGTGDMLDELVRRLPEHSPASSSNHNEPPNLPKLAIVGRPNAGKSSLLNALLGTERSIVHAQRGTTRDSVHAEYKHFQEHMLLIDTAGIRKKNQYADNIEFYAALRALQAMAEADICLLVVDATVGLSSQDMHILRHAQEQKKGLVLLMNKWDAVEKDSSTSKDYEKELRKRLGELSYVPILFGSALKKQRLHPLVQTVRKVYDQRQQLLKTSVLNDRLLEDIAQSPAPAVRGKHIKIKYITQLKPPPPATFLFFCNHPKDVKSEYKRFLIGRLRKHFGLEGVTVTAYFRKK